MAHSPWRYGCTVLPRLPCSYRGPTEAQTTPPLLAVIEGLKKFGVKKFAATGVRLFSSLNDVDTDNLASVLLWWLVCRAARAK